MTEQTAAPQPRKRSGALATALLFLASLLATVIVGEVVVRLAVPVRNVGPTFSEYDPAYGKRLKKSFSCTRVAAEFTMQFSTNSLGFRGPEPASFPSDGILFLGDSFTSGYGVNDGEEYPAVIRRTLEERLGDATPPVVNAGTGNIGNGYWLRFLEAEKERFKPRAVVFGFCVNDFADNAVEGMYLVDGEGKLRTSGAPPPQEGARTAQAIIEAIPGLSYSHLVGLARQFFSEGMGSGSAPQGSAVNDTLTYALLDSIFSLCEAFSLPALVLAIEVGKERLPLLREVAGRHGIDVVIAPSKWDHPELYYHVDGHWNAAGHAYVARVLQPFVERLAAGKPKKG
ncbi:MAG: SGNH/GDSL hydrolase family protein [Bacteroidetes bacterium]|nr:SGNH/GDSL hydrolase family protein [Bacteroidota bacterium]